MVEPQLTVTLAYFENACAPSPQSHLRAGWESLSNSSRWVWHAEDQVVHAAWHATYWYGTQQHELESGLPQSTETLQAKSTTLSSHPTDIDLGACHSQVASRSTIWSAGASNPKFPNTKWDLSAPSNSRWIQCILLGGLVRIEAAARALDFSSHFSDGPDTYWSKVWIAGKLFFFLLHIFFMLEIALWSTRYWYSSITRLKALSSLEWWRSWCSILALHNLHGKLKICCHHASRTATRLPRHLRFVVWKPGLYIEAWPSTLKISLVLVVGLSRIARGEVLMTFLIFGSSSCIIFAVVQYLTVRNVAARFGYFSVFCWVPLCHWDCHK